MATAPPSLSNQPLVEPNGAATAAPLTAPSGLSKSARFAMWIVVLTLCLIALPKGCIDSLPWSAAQQTQKQTQAKVLELEIRTNAAVAAASDAAASARASAACAAAIAAGGKRARDCAKGFAVDARGSLPAGPPATDPLRPVADIAKMTLDASKEKYDSIKDANDRLFSVLAAMGALLAFLGFTGLDSFLAAKTNAEDAAVKAQQAQDKVEKASGRLSKFLDEAYKTENRAEINVSHGITLREMAAVYRQGWELQNPTMELPSNGLVQYRAYLNDALHYLDAALRNKEGLNEILILRAMGTQCNVYRRLEDYEMALAIARQIISSYPGKDDSAYFNAACYCSLIGQRYKVLGGSPPADYGTQAMDYLREAIVMEAENKKVASGDADFKWLKDEKSTEFTKLTT